MAQLDREQLISPDPKYDSLLVARFVNQVMRRGKKSVARKNVYTAFDIIKEKTKQEPLDVFEKAIDNVAPRLEVRSRRIGGATYQVPMEVGRRRATTLAMRWIIKSARSGKGVPFSQRLARELMDANNKEGSAFKKKENVHKMAEANKAFAHFAW